MNRRYTLRERAGYWFDNFMMQGVLSKVKVLLVVTLAFVLVIGLLAAVAKGGFGEAGDNSLFITLMYVLGKGGLNGSEGSPMYIVLMLIAILYCIFFTSMLIGFINQGIRTKTDELGTGQSKVIESGHTLILGFNSATLVLLGELIEANRNQLKPETVVILDEIDRSEMADVIARKLGPSRKRRQLKLTCRTGSIYRFDDLRRCSLETCRNVIVSSNNDFDTVKAIIACSHILNESDVDNDPYIVAAIHGEDAVDESRIAGRSSRAIERLEILPLNEIISRIMVHTSRQPGLSDVFTELFNFADDEFYIVDEDPSFPKFYGKNVEEINRYLKSSYAIGVRKADGTIAIGEPCRTTFGKGDSLILVQEDDDALQVLDIPADVIPTSGRKSPAVGGVCILILGVNGYLDLVLREYANYLHGGSTICISDRQGVLSSVVSADTMVALERKGITLRTSDADVRKRKELRALLCELDPSSVVVLQDHDEDKRESEDENTVRLLLYLRDFRSETKANFSITSEMHRMRNRELVAATGTEDFIIGRHLSSLLIAQISQQRSMAPLFENLLSNEGYEIYMKAASQYVALNQPLDLFSVGQAVSNTGDILIGVRQKDGDSYRVADINPVKYEADGFTLAQYVFTEDDYLVVLARE